MRKAQRALRLGSRLIAARGRAVGVLAATAGLLAMSALALAGSAAALPSNCTQSGITVTCTFSTAGQEGTFAVPANISSVHVVADGGAGARTLRGGGGPGAQVSADLNVPPDSTLFVEVGIGGGAPGI